MREDGGDGVVVSQAPLVEVAVTRRVRVMGSLEDMAVCAMAMNVGVGLGLAMGVDRKEAEACGGEEPKDARREERGLGDPFVGDGGSARTAILAVPFALALGGPLGPIGVPRSSVCSNMAANLRYERKWHHFGVWVARGETHKKAYFSLWRDVAASRHQAKPGLASGCG